MHDIRTIREHEDRFRKSLRRRGTAVDLDPVLELDRERRRLLTEVEALKKERNELSRTIGALRKAGEAFERFGNALKTIVPTATKGLVEGSRNLSNLGQAFDPLGLKTALTVIREQNRTIQALQQAEIRRLENDCERLRKALAQRPGKTKTRKKGRK